MVRRLEAEDMLHRLFAEYRGSGEWFSWQPLVGKALEAGGWEPLLRDVGGPGLDIEVHPVEE